MLTYESLLDSDDATLLTLDVSLLAEKLMYSWFSMDDSGNQQQKGYNYYEHTEPDAS